MKSIGIGIKVNIGISIDCRYRLDIDTFYEVFESKLYFVNYMFICLFLSEYVRFK